jgi:uncharacterized protein
MSHAQVTGLYIYPVKSCGGIQLKEMQVGPTGPKHDREWMIVDENNRFITLRTQPKLAQIKTALQGSFLHLYFDTNKILINTEEPYEQIENVTVWKDTFLAGVATKDINESISDFLQQSVKLVRYQKESLRDLKEAGSNVVKQTMFSDSRPILMTNEETLNSLNAELFKGGHKPASMQRFRSNIIIRGPAAYAEDKIQNVKVGEVNLINPRHCVRCVVITQDALTGDVVSKETLKTLVDIRKRNEEKPTFGVNLTPNSLGLIKVGDTVELS